MRLLLAIAAAVAFSAGAAGCGGDSSSLDPRVAEAYVEAKAQALCVVQPNAYPTQAEQEAAYTDALQSSKLSENELLEAQSAAAEDEELRRRLSDEVEAQCGCPHSAWCRAGQVRRGAVGVSDVPSGQWVDVPHDLKRRKESDSGGSVSHR